MSQLPRSNSITDLGVRFDRELSFAGHIDNIVSSAYKMLGFIMRNCKSFKNVQALKTLYNSFVRSKLEYAALAWNPYYTNKKTTIENVQRKFLKFLWYKTYNTYPVRGFPNDILLDTFHIPSLTLRRINLGLSFLFKLLHNNVDCIYLLSKLLFLIPRISARNCVTFYIQASKTNLLAKSPITFICFHYNSISSDCDIFNCNLKTLLNTASMKF